MAFLWAELSQLRQMVSYLDSLNLLQTAIYFEHIFSVSIQFSLLINKPLFIFSVHHITQKCIIIYTYVWILFSHLLFIHPCNIFTDYKLWVVWGSGNACVEGKASFLNGEIYNQEQHSFNYAELINNTIKTSYSGTQYIVMGFKVDDFHKWL